MPTYNYIRMKLCRRVSTSVCVHEHIMYVCHEHIMYVWIYVFIYVCMYDCTYVCMLLCVCIYVCICMYLCILCIYMCACVFTGAALPMGQGGDVPPTFGSRWGGGGYKSVYRFRGTRGYMKISMCYELSLRVDNDLR